MRALALCVAAALAAACSKTPEPTPETRPAETSTPKASAPSPAKTPARSAKGPREVAWDAPPGWESAPNPSPMRKATYKIKRADGDPEDAELSVSQAGGGVDANVARWTGQFEPKAGEPKRSERKVGDLKVTVVDVRGTFTGGGMPGMPAAPPKPGWAMLGAIVELPGGATWFFKLTGPEKTVSAAGADFDKLLDSLRPK